MYTSPLYTRFRITPPKTIRSLCAWGVLLGGIAGGIVGGGISMASGAIIENNYKMIIFLTLFPSVLGGIIGCITANLLAFSIIGHSIIMYPKSISESLHAQKMINNVLSGIQGNEHTQNLSYSASRIRYSIPHFKTDAYSNSFGIHSSSMAMHVQAVQQLQKRGMAQNQADYL